MNTVLFDLDATVLPMDQHEFVDNYITLLTSYMESKGYNSKDIVPVIWKAFAAMEKNDGMLTNEELFWNVIMEELKDVDASYDKKFRRKFEKDINKFYKDSFLMIRYITKPNQDCYESVKMLQEKGYQLVLATKPVFPEIAVLERLSWTGLKGEDFSYITTYENSNFTKPNLKYYEYILKLLDKDPGDCLMVGNDVKEDMVASKLGIDVFLVEDYLLNPDNDDTSNFKAGNWSLFKEYVSNLPTLK